MGVVVLFGLCFFFSFPRCDGFTGLINRNAASIKCVDLSLHVSVPCILGPGDSEVEATLISLNRGDIN